MKEFNPVIILKKACLVYIVKYILTNEDKKLFGALFHEINKDNNGHISKNEL
jgi:hypothetical protein